MTDINNNTDNAPDLTEQLGYLTALLRRADIGRRHAGRGGRDGRRGFDGEIRAGQGRVLGILALQSPLTQKNLAYMLGVRPQSLSELVTKLETKGLVTRRRDDNDRRSFLIELTAAGREAATEIDSLAAEDPFEVLTVAEQATYAALTTKVIEALEEKYPDALDERGPRRHGGHGGHGGRDGHGGHGGHGGRDGHGGGHGGHGGRGGHGGHGGGLCEGPDERPDFLPGSRTDSWEATGGSRRGRGPGFD